MIASITSIPIIGVPIKTANLDGLDSLLSIVQMPAGVPVATVAINGAKNAGILACEILGLKYARIALRIEKYKKDLEQKVLHKAKEVEYEKIRAHKNHRLPGNRQLTFK
jgi:5-(carboxyamino)imidazole ribonucleotide mutase